MRDADFTSLPMLTRRDWLTAGAIFAVALVARLLFLFTSPDRDWPHSIYYEGDAIVWVEYALALDRGEAYEFNLPIHPPGVAYPLAWFYPGARASGFTTMKTLWCAMSAAACALTYFACAAAPMRNRRIGVIAALLLTFSFGQYVLATSLNSETPYVMLLPAMVLLTQRLMVQPNRWLAAGLGALHGAALLLRPEHPLLMILWIAWMLLEPARERTGRQTGLSPSVARARIAPIAIMLLGALLVCLPWTVRANLSIARFNRVEPVQIDFDSAPMPWSGDARAALERLPAFARNDNFIAITHLARRQGLQQITAADVDRFFDETFGYTPQPLSNFTLVSNQGPLSFALANHPQADGGFSRAALAHPIRGNDPTFAFSFPPHLQLFNEGWSIGWTYAADDPGRWLTLVWRKFQRFIGGVTHGFGAANLAAPPLGRFGVREPVDMLVADAGGSAFAQAWGILGLALITAGAVLALARRLAIAPWLLVIVYKIIVAVLFYGYARQAASIAPAFFICMAIAIDSLLLPVDRRWPRWQRWQTIIVIATCIVMLASDALWSRRSEQVAVVGQIHARFDLAPGAFQANGRIEIRPAPAP